MAVDPYNICIHIKRKELNKKMRIISNCKNPFGVLIYIQLFKVELLFESVVYGEHFVKKV